MTAPEIEREIERTRTRLGDTVDELAAKADVRARARDMAAELKARAQEKAAGLSGQLSQGQAAQRRWPIAATAAAVLVAGTVVLVRRRRRSK